MIVRVDQARQHERAVEVDDRVVAASGARRSTGRASENRIDGAIGASTPGVTTRALTNETALAQITAL